MLSAKFTQAHAAFGRGICHLLFTKGNSFDDIMFASLEGLGVPKTGLLRKGRFLRMAYYSLFAFIPIEDGKNDRVASQKGAIQYFNPIAPKKARIVYNFSLSECNRVNESSILSHL